MSCRQLDTLKSDTKRRKQIKCTVMLLFSERAFEWFLVFDPKCASKRKGRKTFLRDFSFSILGKSRKMRCQTLRSAGEKIRIFFLLFLFCLISYSIFTLTLIRTDLHSRTPAIFFFFFFFSLFQGNSRTLPRRSHRENLSLYFSSLYDRGSFTSASKDCIECFLSSLVYARVYLR